MRFSCLPEPWTLSDFDLAAQPGVDEKLIRDLATLRFLDNAANILLVGPPCGCRKRQPPWSGPLRCCTCAEEASPIAAVEGKPAAAEAAGAAYSQGHAERA